MISSQDEVSHVNTLFSAYEKYEYGYLGNCSNWYIESIIYTTFLLYFNFKEKKAVSGKTPFFLICPFCTSYLIWLLRGQFCMEMFRFQLQYSQLKNSNPVFERFEFFNKTCFKVKVLKTFKIFNDCHINTCRSSKWRAFFKIPSTAFQRNLRSFFCF